MIDRIVMIEDSKPFGDLARDVAGIVAAIAGVLDLELEQRPGEPDGEIHRVQWADSLGCGAFSIALVDDGDIDATYLELVAPREAEGRLVFDILTTHLDALTDEQLLLDVGGRDELDPGAIARLGIGWSGEEDLRVVRILSEALLSHEEALSGAAILAALRLRWPALLSPLRRAMGHHTDPRTRDEMSKAIGLIERQNL